MRHRRSTRAAESATVLEDGRTVRVRVVGWRRPQEVTDNGRVFYREQFERDGLAPDETAGPVLAEFEHGGPVVGKAVEYESADDGLYADVRVADTTTGRDLLAMVDEGLVSVSAEFEDAPHNAAAGELVTRSQARLVRIAFTHVPQHQTAAVLGRRSHHEETTNMDDEITEAETTTEETTEAETTTEETTTTTETVQRSQPARRPSPALTKPAGAVSRFRSLGDLSQQIAAGKVSKEERQAYFRALNVADTGDTTGLVRTQWLNNVVDLIRASTPTVQAFEQVPLPDKGLTISQATVGTRPTIAKQAAQGDAISSTVATIVPVNWTVDTWAGGQGTSIQTILRTEPEYWDQMMRLYMVEMALKVETDVVAALVAAANDVHTTVELSNTETDFDEAFVDAAALILGSAGIRRLPSLAVINVAMWVKLAKAKDTTGRPLFPGVNMMNPQGSMDITSENGEVRSLRWFVAPMMANTIARAVVGVPEAFRTALGSVQTMQADVPETLTRENAVFQMGAYGKVDARGLALIEDAA